MGTWNLKGSKIRDEWRYLHKQKLGKGYHGIDGDYFLVDFKAGIVAYLDLKHGDDSITETEKVAYQEFIDKEIPVYIIDIRDVEKGHFYILGYPDMEYLKMVRTWGEFGEWEKELRHAARS